MREEQKKPARHDATTSGGDEKLNELEECRKKSEEYLNGWKRERADFLNYKKEEMERIGQVIKYANEELILKILPILDNICLAEQHTPQDNEWVQGFLQIKKQLSDFLAKEGIEAIEVLDKPFDPNTMESVGEIDCSRPDLEQKLERKGSGIVIEEVQRGYTLHGKVIRPAKVKISK